MFKLSKEPTFTHAVKVQVPIDGGHREETFKATFRIVPTDAAAKFNFLTEEGTGDFLRAAIVRLDQLEDESGAPLSYSEEVRDAVIRRPDARLALASAYFSAVGGQRAKN